MGLWGVFWYVLKMSSNFLHLQIVLSNFLNIITETCFERKVTSHFCKGKVGGISHGTGYPATTRTWLCKEHDPATEAGAIHRFPLGGGG